MKKMMKLWLRGLWAELMDWCSDREPPAAPTIYTGNFPDEAIRPVEEPVTPAAPSGPEPVLLTGGIEGRGSAEAATTPATDALQVVEFENRVLHRIGSLRQQRLQTIALVTRALWEAFRIERPDWPAWLEDPDACVEAACRIDHYDRQRWWPAFPSDIAFTSVDHQRLLCQMANDLLGESPGRPEGLAYRRPRGIRYV